MTETTKTHVILLSCGSFNPITKGHIHMFGEYFAYSGGEWMRELIFNSAVCCVRIYRDSWWPRCFQTLWCQARWSIRCFCDEFLLSFAVQSKGAEMGDGLKTQNDQIISRLRWWCCAAAGLAKKSLYSSMVLWTQAICLWFMIFQQV